MMGVFLLKHDFNISFRSPFWPMLVTVASHDGRCRIPLAFGMEVSFGHTSSRYASSSANIISSGEAHLNPSLTDVMWKALSLAQAYVYCNLSCVGLMSTDASRIFANFIS